MKSLVKNEFYVYVYLDPRKPGKYLFNEFEFNYEPFYIGKGYSYRWIEYIQNCHLQNDNNKLKINKINKIIKQYGKPLIVKYKENLIEKDAFDLEMKMIKTIGRINLNNGPLVNLTDGGEGSSGRITNENTKIKISKSNKGRKCSQEFRERRRQYMLNEFKPKPMSEKQKLQMKERMIGKYSGDKNPRAIYLYKIIDPMKNEYNVSCLKIFCKENNLIYPSVQDAIKRNKPYKGWIFYRYLRNK